jgi:hypothetical protein
MIPTAEEFLKNKPFMRSDLQCETNYQLMIEFAKLHVEAALKAILENVKVKMIDNCSDHTPYRGECGKCGSYHNYKIASEEVDEESIINAYPLTNIK